MCDNCSSISTSHSLFFVFILGFGLVWLFISWVWVGWGGWDSYLASFIVLGGWAVYGRNGIDYSFVVEALETWMVAWPDGLIRLEVT